MRGEENGKSRLHRNGAGNQRVRVMVRLYAGLFVLGVAAAAGTADALAQDAPPPAMPAVMTAPLERSRAAIAQCRERRLKKEIATYQQSAQCASPLIYAAWRDAGYPHMDLITAWLNAREAASAKVDQKAITAKEFEQQMAAITNRLTAEEQRRRSGQLRSADSTLQLELPASAQVVGVVMPAGQEKLAAKRSATARAVAYTQYVDPAAAAQLQALAPLAGLDSQKLSSGVGGPLVAVPVSGAGGLYAHLASQRSEPEARAAFRVLQSQYPNILGGRDAVIRRADGGDGTFFRVEIGPLTAAQADQICGGLKAAGGKCVTQYE